MFTLPADFRLDQPSFWIGFIAGILFLWVIRKIASVTAQTIQTMRESARKAREEMAAGTEVHFRNDVLKHAQNLHLAAPLFSLDEILIEPRLLSPPIRRGGEQDTSSDEASSLVIPYLPDWPELGSTYGVPTLTLAEALSEGANLVLLGHSGSGKTVALAHLASLIARRSKEAGQFAGFIPILIHAADLWLDERKGGSALEILINAVSRRVSPLTLQRLPAFLRLICEEKRALLLLDGLDDLPTASQVETAVYVGALLKEYPSLRIVAAASIENFAGLNRFGLVPIVMAAWGDDQRKTFTREWGNLWQQFVIPATPADVEGGKSNTLDEKRNGRENELLMLGKWLSRENPAFTPLEFTLKVWAAYAGDALGPGPADAIEAYLRRMTADIPQARPALENLAKQMVSSQRPIGTHKEALGWMSDLPSQALPKLLDRGLLTGFPESKLTLVHPVIAGYLAASALATMEVSEILPTLPDGYGKALTLRSLASLRDISTLADQYLEAQEDPLLRNPLEVAHWLTRGTRQGNWRRATIQFLVTLLKDEKVAFGLRARALTALATSGESGIDLLFQQLLRDIHPDVRQLAALGCGLCHDTLAIEGLGRLLSDPVSDVNRAAVLALTVIGSDKALELVASALLHGDEALRRAAAEALATHPEEGHPTLVDGSTLDDLLVRRAVVYGLLRVKEPWAIQTLEKMALEDGQWVVRSAATQALEVASRPDPHIPQPPKSLSETPWLITFAGERGLGVTPKSAANLLFMALHEGNQAQRLAALDVLRQRADQRAAKPLNQMLVENEGVLREATFNTLWHMAASGLDIAD